MKSSGGNNIQYHIFGESHSAGIGIVVSGLPANFEVDFEKIDYQLMLRQGNSSINTKRQEKVEYEILSGIFNNKTTGSSICVVFKNKDINSNDYASLKNHNRPGHADFVASQKFNRANDYRGGGHFSGRITTPLVFLGALILQIIEKNYPDFKIISHIKQFQLVKDYDYYSIRKVLVSKMFNNKNADHTKILNQLTSSQQKNISTSLTTSMNKILSSLIKDDTFPIFNQSIKDDMFQKALLINEEKDSAGGQVETIILNPPPFIGEPFFYSLESVISSLLYSIPSVKSVEFGYGNQFINAKGSQVKDEYIFMNESIALSLFNYNGGINGGISNGDDIVFSTTIKPISSIRKIQHTFSSESEKIEPLQINGRHDITIINRVVPIINALSAIAIYDLMLTHKK